MTKSFAYSLIVASALVAGAAPAVLAKATIIPGQNNSTFAAVCDRSKTCINWGGGVYTNGGTGGVICNDKKCVKIPDDAPARTGNNDNRGNDTSGSTVDQGGSKGDMAGSFGGNPGSMGNDSGPSID